MKIFVDTADLDEIKEAFSWGIVDGITTNPSLIKKAVDKMKSSGSKESMESYITKILETARGFPVSLEVIGTSADDMIAEGKNLFNRFNPVAENVNIKIPVNPSMDSTSPEVFDGIRAVSVLSGEGIPVNCTLIFTPEQAMLAAKAGAAFVSPFAGRIDDMLRKEAGMDFEKTDYYPMDGKNNETEMLEDNGIVSGVDLVMQCVTIFENFKFKTEIIAASLRNSRQLRECALSGAHIATVPFDVLKQAMSHVKTAEGMAAFAEDTVPEYKEVVSRKSS